ncbi:hypothetical protein [Anaerocolumna sp.]|uniref:hypothetical protein n=1 Tax=Anaerocolumna sp. TaxID=2041569 RepID=UPI0028AEDE89|nr:hypothetical protein [Anaerocolumna sp.]
MNEILLINMIGQLDPELLEDNYMEKDLKKDLKKGILSFLGKILKKIAKQQYGSSFLQALSIKNECEKQIEQDKMESDNNDFETEDSNIVEPGNKIIMDGEVSHMDYYNADVDSIQKEDKAPDNLDTRGLNIGIFKKNIRNLTKVISGIAATFVVILSIIIILIKRHKSGIKLLKKSIQVIY